MDQQDEHFDNSKMDGDTIIHTHRHTLLISTFIIESQYKWKKYIKSEKLLITFINIFIHTLADVAITLAEFGNNEIKLGKNISANVDISPLRWTAKQLNVTHVSLTTCERRSLIDSLRGTSNVRKDIINVERFTLSNCIKARNSFIDSILTSHSAFLFDNVLCIDATALSISCCEYI